MFFLIIKRDFHVDDDVNMEITHDDDQKVALLLLKRDFWFSFLKSKVTFQWELRDLLFIVPIEIFFK
jgi:hypothetical protein